MNKHPLLTLILIVANVPVYMAIWRLFFRNLQGYLDCLNSIGLYCWGETARQQQDDFYARLKLIFFVPGSAAFVITEYHLIAWLFLR